MATLTLGLRSFRSKDAARAEIRRILHSREIDRELTDTDDTLIRALYNQHPRKDGSPRAFCVGINRYHGADTRGFQALYDDGSRKPWSYIPCLTPENDAPNLLSAMRAAIIPSQRDALRNAYQSRDIIRCYHCKSDVEKPAAHVHHLPPKFRDIASAFIGLVGIPVVRTAALGDDFADQGLKQRWVAFHDAVAQRVVLCADCNRKDERED